MKTIDWDETTTCRDIVEAVAKEDLVLRWKGRAVALVLPLDDDDLTWYVRERDPAFLASLVKAREQVEKGHALGHEDLEKTLGFVTE